ncbi:MAG: NapC/NirT family cytochrome c [Coriobacteriia bacterium]|nr:NapC/NirT family cytochrome c [Coriobacteriia bacterium]
MACHPIAAFKNPVTRPRAIIWTGTILASLCMLVFVMFAATTSYWFCAGICHSVQDDTIGSYQRSAHSNVSCIACHLPANANPLVYAIHKVEALPELPMAIFGNYTLPLNAESEVSMSKKLFPDTQCTQCHDLSTREVTPSSGIIIDHTAHADEGVRCTMCHNRVAHNESGDWSPTGVNPKTKEPSAKHADFLTMTACYRCHGLEKGSPAPGTCLTCHPKTFNFKPSDHATADFMKNHGKLAKAEVEKVAEATKETGVPSPTADEKFASVEKLAAQKNDKSSKDDATLAPVGTIDRCYSCHDKATFCDKCHGK